MRRWSLVAISLICVILAHKRYETTIKRVDKTFAASWPPFFPDIDERVKYYMGSWYDHQITNSSTFCQLIQHYDTSKKALNHAYLFDRRKLQLASWHGASHYTRDVLRFYFQKSNPEKLRLILLFGDSQAYDNFPVMLKAREVQSAKRIQYAESPDPILAPLNTGRHFGMLQYSKYLDREWHSKREALVWRGVNTGKKRSVGNRKQVVERFWNHSVQDIDIAFNRILPEKKGENKEEDIEKYVRPGKNMWQLLQYKYLMSIEGNDVATGLKWMLYSNSVVFMAPPTHVTWAMEDKLIPYYHFIPIKPDYSDLYEQVQWARRNDVFCHQMSKQATNYVSALWASKKAILTNQGIIDRIISRYHRLYGESLAGC